MAGLLFSTLEYTYPCIVSKREGFSISPPTSFWGWAFLIIHQHQEFIPACLEGLADIASAQGEPTWAARLWGTSEAQREAYGTPLAAIYRAHYEQAVTAARTQLGEKSFDALWAEGRTMSLEQALAAKGTAEIPAAIPVKPPLAPQAHMPSISPAGLTNREMEVLRLLAQGLTSAQIAQQLVIGLVTVNSHVRSIYSKLGVTSRAAATRYALEHKLL
jgi:DNA-binding CsgD family transcriptional regulator